MPFKKGKSGNPAGRKPGSENIVNTKIKEAVLNFVGENITTIQNDYDNLEPKDRLMFIDKLLAYSLPKLSSQQVKADIDATVKTQPLINFGDTSEKDAT